MDKLKMYELIFAEKQGRTVISSVYPLGILITLDSEKRLLNELIGVILGLLESNPKFGLDWSSHWGRAIIQQHPRCGFSARFTMRKDCFEKLGVFVSTNERFTPADFIDHTNNSGKYHIALNNDSMLYEGIILSVERMIDELVWCNYRQYILTGSPETAETYLEAVRDVINGGVKISCLTEDDILDLKQANPLMPVRVYGKMYKDVKVPHIIGCILETNEHLKVPVLFHSIAKSSKLNMVSMQKKTERIDVLCISITTGKPLHFGHLLHLGYAEMLRNLIGVTNEIIIESNDVGERIVKLVARLAEVTHLTIESTISQLIAQKFDEEIVYLCYRERERVETKVFIDAMKLMKRNSHPVMQVIEKKIIAILASIGINARIVRDSECQEEFSKLFESNQGFLDKCGFQSTVFKENGNPRLVVTKKAGMPSAPAMRASFITKLVSSDDNHQQVLFVDSNHSVRIGTKLAKLKNVAIESDYIEGVGIGFNFEIGSSTKANIPLAESIIYNITTKGLASNQIRGFLAYFVLTRTLTAKGHKAHPLSQGSPLDQSFHDYASVESLNKDIDTAVVEYQSFLSNIHDKFTHRNIETCSESPSLISKDVEELKLKIISEEHVKTLGRVILTSRIVTLDEYSRKFREVLHYKNRNIDSARIDGEFVASVLAGEKIDHEVIKFINGRGLKTPKGIGKKVRSIFTADLARRGYCENQLVERTLDYLSGRYVLTYWRVLQFERLKSILDTLELNNNSHKIDVFKQALLSYSTLFGFLLKQS